MIPRLKIRCLVTLYPFLMHSFGSILKSFSLSQSRKQTNKLSLSFYHFFSFFLSHRQMFLFPLLSRPLFRHFSLSKRKSWMMHLSSHTLSIYLHPSIHPSIYDRCSNTEAESYEISRHVCTKVTLFQLIINVQQSRRD